jgi:hypothetical protein
MELCDQTSEDKIVQDILAYCLRGKLLGCSPFIYSTDGDGASWLSDPEPLALIGLSLPLLCLVIRPQVPSSCPSPEAATHEECFRTHPVALRRPEQGGYTRVSRAWRLRAPLFSVEQCCPEPAPLNRCVVPPQAVSSHRNQVNRRSLLTTFHSLFCGWPPRPRRASVCLLDNESLIGVNRRSSDASYAFASTLSKNSSSTRKYRCVSST